MEHRWGRRAALDVEVTINDRPLALLRGRIRNISISGAFVQTKISLPINTRVELVFTPHKDDPNRVYRLDAIVLRRTPEGLGMMFSQFNPKSLADLIDRAAIVRVESTNPTSKPSPRKQTVAS